MAKSTTWENDLMLLVFNNTNSALIGDATGLRGSTTAGVLYVSLHTADPASGNQTTNETAYTSYARQSINRASGAGGFTVSTNSVTNASTISFPQCTGGTSTITHFGVGTALSGTGKLLYSGTVSPNISVSNGVTPQVAASGLTITEV